MSHSDYKRRQRTSYADRPRAGFPWTPEENIQMEAELAHGKTIPDIAAIHGRSHNAISMQIERLANYRLKAEQMIGAAESDWRQVKKAITPAPPPERTKGVVLGSKYTGRPAAYAYTVTGEYWSVLDPMPGEDAIRLQKALLKGERK